MSLKEIVAVATDLGYDTSSYQNADIARAAILRNSVELRNIITA
jgi:hypothetical protein